MPANLPTMLQYASAASAFVSAGLWLWSAKMRLPPHTMRLWLGDRPAPSTPRRDKEAWQSTISAAAALATGVAALLQGLAMALS